MNDGTVMNRTMDSRKYQAPSCDTFTTAQEFVYKPLQAPNHVNYYDIQFSLSEEVKKEFPEDECTQSSASENKELTQVIEKQEIKQENSEDMFIRNEAIVDEQYPFIVKIESLEEYRILDNIEDDSIHYEVLVTPQQVRCKLCARTFKNRLTLIKHNNRHIKVVLYPIPVDIEMNELHKCQYCDEYFKNHDNMLAHIRNVHNKIHKSELYHEGIKPHLTGRNGKDMKYKCDSYERVYKSKAALLSHTKKVNLNYESMFTCWCGKLFHSWTHFCAHKYRHHGDRIKNKNKFQCDYCQKKFKIKNNLVVHMKSVHYDYGKIFKCWCGKQFRTPIRLSLHKKRQHGPKVNIINNEQFQCDYCHRCFKIKSRLVTHIKSVHYDYGEIFECWCGKQFRTPIHLSQHKKRQHDAKVNIMNNEEFQCDYCTTLFKTKRLLIEHIKSVHYDYDQISECERGIQFHTQNHLSLHKTKQLGPSVKIVNNEQLPCNSCHKFFKTKCLLAKHIKNVHYDYGKTFECECGKQFRTPNQLSLHKKRLHGPKVNIINNEPFQCDSCYKFFKTKRLLARHIKSIHYDYGKTFECSCGKQFRSPIRLYQHNQRMHNVDVENVNNEQFQCNICQKLFKAKKYLTEHIKNVHYDYGKIFECWCGKEFRSPIYLRVHKYRQHDTNSNCDELQCDHCGKFFKNKEYISKHIKNVHYDYGKMFLCWCGKQFSTPVHLGKHKKRQHNTTNDVALKEQFQCHICQKILKTKKYLTGHIKNIHYDYGKMFECRCGKQFRTPLRLRIHERERHNCTSNNKNKDMVNMNTNIASQFLNCNDN